MKYVGLDTILGIYKDNLNDFVLTEKQYNTMLMMQEDMKNFTIFIKEGGELRAYNKHLDVFDKVVIHP